MQLQSKTKWNYTQKQPAEVLSKRVLLQKQPAYLEPSQTFKMWLSCENNLRSNGPEVFCKEGVLKSFAKLTGKHLRQSLFFNKVIKKETLVQVLRCELCKISKNTFFHWNTSGGCSCNFLLKTAIFTKRINYLITFARTITTYFTTNLF